MPKSYKICPVRSLRVERFSAKPLQLAAQQSFPGVPAAPQTSIYRSADQIKLVDFQSFVIEHEHEVTVHGRVNDTRFAAFIQMGIIKAYYSAAKGLVLLTGKKADILDFCRQTGNMPNFKIATIAVDMKRLLAKLGEVKLAWFRFPKGLIRASALMGAHLEKTSAFKVANSEGDISTLSFYFEDASGNPHPVVVTDDGAVVLQDSYAQIADEVELVLNLKRLLLDGIYEEQEIVPGRRKAQ